MSDLLNAISEALAAINLARRKGDAMRKAQRESDAQSAYREGLREAQPTISAAIAACASGHWKPSAAEAKEMAELHGSAGGLLQRLGELAPALESYKHGAALEEQFALPGTYNRLNALKLELLTGSQSLAALSPSIDGLARHIQDELELDKRVADSGWVFADLGDCLALLGQTDAAARAYSTFIAKAELPSPARALDVLKQLAAAMRHTGDADAGRLDAAIDTLQSQLKPG